MELTRIEERFLEEYLRALKHTNEKLGGIPGCPLSDNKKVARLGYYLAEGFSMVMEDEEMRRDFKGHIGMILETWVNVMVGGCSPEVLESLKINFSILEGIYYKVSKKEEV